MTNAALIRSFYEAFQQRDHAAMGRCYLPNARFRDEVFSLEGFRVPAMWRMLCERGKDLRIEFTGVEADDTTGSARWDAWYTFSASGRKVHNVIQARFGFVDGLIDDHKDEFNFHKWSRQALGLPGLLFGWSSLFQNAVRKKSAAALEKYIQAKGIT